MKNFSNRFVHYLLKMPSVDELKKMAADKSVSYLKSGMCVGLGTGSTVFHVVNKIAELVKSGELKDMKFASTSNATTKQAISLGLKIDTLDDCKEFDIAIDGADEVDPSLQLVKGFGGALTREKLVELCAKELIIVVDDSKMSPILGKRSVPVEIVPFGYTITISRLECLKCESKLRMDGDKPYVTDNGNYIVHLTFKDGINDVKEMSEKIKSVHGVVEHGLFVDMASRVIIAKVDGIEIKEK